MFRRCVRGDPLSISNIQSVRNQARSSFRRSLIKSVLRASRIQVGAFCRVPHIRPISLIPCSKAVASIKRRMTQRIPTADGVDIFLDIVSIVSEIDPWFTVRGVAQGVID